MKEVLKFLKNRVSYDFRNRILYINNGITIADLRSVGIGKDLGNFIAEAVNEKIMMETPRPCNDDIEKYYDDVYDKYKNLEVIDTTNYELKYCEKCISMTNHIGNECQRCKKIQV